MKKDFVTAIIPAYNAAKYIEAALKSVLEQSIPPNEIIVIDDGSTDETYQIVSSFKEVKILRQKNKGTAAALNAGIEMSSGDLLAFLDADDIWMPNRLELQLQILKQQPEVEMVFGGIIQFVSDELSEEEKLKIEYPDKPMKGIHKSCWLIRRDSFMKVGFFRGGFALEEFVDWYVRSKELKIKEVILSQVIAKRRIHTSNSSRINKNLRKDFPKILKTALDRRRQNS